MKFFIFRNDKHFLIVFQTNFTIELFFYSCVIFTYSIIEPSKLLTFCVDWDTF